MNNTVCKREMKAMAATWTRKPPGCAALAALTLLPLALLASGAACRRRCRVALAAFHSSPTTFSITLLLLSRSRLSWARLPAVQAKAGSADEH